MQSFGTSTVALLVCAALSAAATISAAKAQGQPTGGGSQKASPPAAAQVQTPPAASDAPQRTTATYGDWIVQCETQAGPPPQKVCDMAQTAQAQVQGRAAPFSRVAVAHPVKGQPVRLSVQVPVNVSFDSPVHIQIADSDPGVVAPFARCIPNGCFADFDIKDDLLKKFRAATETGKLTFADSTRHDVSVPLSFNGFNQAFDMLSKE
jgi:invasion protein IalB